MSAYKTGKVKAYVCRGWAIKDTTSVFLSAKAKKKARKAREEAGGDAAEPELETYVTVRVESQSMNTSLRKGPDPFYDETLEFIGNFKPEDNIDFTLMRRSLVTSGDDTIGDMVLSLGSILEGLEAGGLYDVQNTAGETVGKLEVKLSFQETSFATEQHTPAGELAADIPTPANATKIKAEKEQQKGQKEQTTSKPYTPSEDPVDKTLAKFEGPRPGALRTEWYYSHVKGVYLFFAGLPVLRIAAPRLEFIVEAVLLRTPLRPKQDTSEAADEQHERKATAHLDKTIERALSGIDDVVDHKKDECIRGLIGLKNNVKGLKPEDKSIVEASVDAVKHVSSSTTGAISRTVGDTYNGITGFIGGMWGKTYDSVTSTAGGVYHKTTETAYGAVDGVKGVVGGAVHKAQEVAGGAVNIAGGAVDGVKGAVGGAVHKAQEIAGGAVGKAQEVAGGAVGKAQVVAGKAQEVAGGAVSKAQEVAGGAVTKAQEVAGGVAAKAGEVANGVKEGVEAGVKVAGDVVSDVGAKVGLGGGATDEAGEGTAEEKSQEAGGPQQ